ncbi:hypothetical protein [Teredinibacter sp. KSP-S5-2]|uniref:hypothetical protein n=1 Tax=Teredinibacter sp. KSP-S5-2 TaxID=3034506 RepID=UPI002935125B|nr:hypothetical protein [Teredinibacter sp. KSP-S5-2]WNO10491.1 hypothetical protein P5V12_04830 [Teredinibacter sp. KSP-S5-2]
MIDDRKKLEKMKDKLRKRREKYKNLESELPENEHRILGPRNDIEYQKMKRDIKGAGDD